METKYDAVDRPKHYQCPFPLVVSAQLIEMQQNRLFIQALDVIKAWGLQHDFYLGNVIKYILRAGKKDDQAYLQDLKKARFYLDAKITELEEANATNTR